MQDERTIVVNSQAEFLALPTRRDFFRVLGLGGALVLTPAFFAACTDDNTVTSPATTGPQTISLASDAGIFTFAYVLEQLEATFYSQVLGLAQFSTLFNAAERSLFADILNDELVHRELIRTAIGNSFPTLSFNFSSVPLTTAGILSASVAFSNTGIAAYNGSGYLLKNVNNLLVAGKIVSVEGRHAASLSDALDLRSATPTGTLFADLTATIPAPTPLALPSLGSVPASALDVAAAATTALTAAQPFIVNPITLA